MRPICWMNSLILLGFFLCHCAPIEAPSYFSKEDIDDAFFVEGALMPGGWQAPPLKTLIESAACSHLEERIWSHIYATYSSENAKAFSSEHKKRIKGSIKNALAGKRASPRQIRDFSNDLISIYDRADAFFTGLFEDEMLEQFSLIEDLKDNKEGPEPEAPLLRFFTEVQETAGDIRKRALLMNWDCAVSYPASSFILQKGMNLFQIAEALSKKGIIEKAAFLRASRNKNWTKSLLGRPLESFEGYLHPGVYSFSRGEKASILISTMVKRFLKVYKTLDNPRKIPRHSVVTLASMIEKEALLNHEKRRIASVFHNRIKINMKLQSDPTVSYGLWMKTGRNPGPPTRKQIAQTSRYNTYSISGLPPGPISSPNIHSLRAVLNPEKTPFYYFVSTNGRTHVFSSNYEDHKRAARKL